MRQKIALRMMLFSVILVGEFFAALIEPHYRVSGSYERGLPIVFLAAFLVFGARQFAFFLSSSRVDLRYAFANAIFLAAFILIGRQLSFWLPEQGPPHIGTVTFLISLIGWVVCLGLSFLSLLAVFIRPSEIVRLVVATKSAGVYALFCAIASIGVRGLASGGWNSFGGFLQVVTFRAAAFVLRLLYPTVVSIPEVAFVGTGRFNVVVRGICSGIEGIALIATLTVTWLFFARRELRLERAALLVPISMVVMWTMNLLRIVGLIAIGDAGHPHVAMNGFHSVAGWIGFNIVSAAFLLIAHRVRWFRRPLPEDENPIEEDVSLWRNVPAIYLSPFLAIIVASLIGAATTGGFEWLYPLRFFAALIMLWAFRHEYRKMDWRFGWVGIVSGILVGASWLVVRHWLDAAGAGPDPTTVGLGSMVPWARVGWIMFRVLAAVITVPIAEELAFRGFVARRVSSADPETIPYAKISWVGIGLSAVLFGLLHGKMWLPGIVTGVIFALVTKWKNRLGEAVAAHAFANGVIAVVALVSQNYSLW